jgi:phosphoribosyl 1,2-cyclic phosphate phosphodiesterase
MDQQVSRARMRVCYNVRMTGPRTFTFLGTGTSVGVPMLGCDCAVCQSPDPRNHRYRCSVLIRTARGNLLIDTTPEVRLQLLRARVGVVHAVLFTHYHADHLMGLDDLRPMQKYLEGPVPLFCTAETEQVIRRAFAYAFRENGTPGPAGYVPQLAFRRIGAERFTVLGEEVQPIPLVHGPYDVLGFRIGDVAYCTDVNRIPDASWPLLQGLRVLILDALRIKPHYAHFGLNEALEVIAQLRPERAYLTHMTHELEHEATNRLLPPGVALAHDGLEFAF